MIEQTQSLAFSDRPETHPDRKTRRGIANALRRGLPKIHRRHVPEFTGTVPRGAAAKMVARLRKHDWTRNHDLITLRQRGYIPYARRNDPTFVPKPMRITARRESREALTALSLALAANCDYNPESDYAFEVMCSFEDIARAMGVLHIYENGRKTYDVALNALSVLEQMGTRDNPYIVVKHDQDSDTGQNKAMRMWLGPRFFTSRGISLEDVRHTLHQYRQWAIKNGLSETLKQRYQRHLMNMARHGIDIVRNHALKKLLIKLRRQVVSPELLHVKESTVVDLERELAVRQGQRKPRKARPFWDAFVRWERTVAPIESNRLQATLAAEHPGLKQKDAESFYRLLLEKAGIR
ncbi:Replication protein [Chimaeribacter arupi]|nr:Replication protein [Chimaeribacter arupi]